MARANHRVAMETCHGDLEGQAACLRAPVRRTSCSQLILHLLPLLLAAPTNPHFCVVGAVLVLTNIRDLEPAHLSATLRLTIVLQVSQDLKTVKSEITM